MGLFDDKMYGKSMLAMVFIHSRVCSNEESFITFQKKDLKHWHHPSQCSTCMCVLVDNLLQWKMNAYLI